MQNDRVVAGHTVEDRAARAFEHRIGKILDLDAFDGVPGAVRGETVRLDSDRPDPVAFEQGSQALETGAVGTVDPGEVPRKRRMGRAGNAGGRRRRRPVGARDGARAAATATAPARRALRPKTVRNILRWSLQNFDEPVGRRRAEHAERRRRSEAGGIRTQPHHNHAIAGDEQSLLTGNAYYRHGTRTASAAGHDRPCRLPRPPSPARTNSADEINLIGAGR